MRLPNIVQVLFIVYLTILLAVEYAQGCSCFYAHPQTHYCVSDYVIVAKIRNRIISEYEMVYEIRVLKNYKLANSTFGRPISNGYLYSANLDSVCGVDLTLGETYILTGRIVNDKPRVTLCDLAMRWCDATRRQRKGFKSLYKKGCNCQVSYTEFEQKGQALHEANGKLCPWEGHPGPTECQEKYGVCIMKKNRCFWMPSKYYNECIKDHYRGRQQRSKRESP